MPSSYCTISDVNALVPQSPFTSTTVPTQAQVEQFIVDISTIIDATLGNLGYTVPIPVASAPQTKIILTRLTASGALGLALQVRLTAVSPDSALTNNVWTLRFEKWLTALKDNTDPFELPDAPRTGKQVIKPIGELMQNPMNNSVDSGLASDQSNYLTRPFVASPWQQW